MKKRVLIACEESATVRDAFIAAGYDAWSCDILPTRGRAANHLQGDVRWAVEARFDKFKNITGRVPVFKRWDLMIAHPPCTYLSVSGLHWNKSRPERAVQTEKALKFVASLLDADIDAIALENPISCISSRIRKPDQIIQPYQFGDDASKATCLWLKGLPLLAIDPQARCAGRLVVLPNGKTVERWANQTDSGQNVLGPSEHRQRERSKTYPGIAQAFLQWGAYI